MVTLGFAFKERGSFGNIYGNKGSQKEMMSKMQGGGITRGGKSQRGARRTISKGKYKRVLAPQKPSKTELKTEAFTKPENKILKESTEQLDKTKYFGPILAVSSKIMNKEEPTQRDYQNVGLGINMLISQGIQQQQLKGGIVAAFAGGGLVDPDVLSAAETGGDISNWVAKTFRGEVESNAQKTMRMIREMKEKKKIPGVDGSGGPEEEQYPPGLGGSSNAPDVPGTASEKFKFIYELARKAGDPFPEVTAAQSIQEAGYNLSKQHTGTFNVFGQTGRHPTLGGVTLGTPRDPGGGSKTFMNFASYEEAARYRVRKWVPQYGNAATPYEALMNIQKRGGTGRYAQGFPTRAFPQGDWMAYVTSVSNIIKNNGMDPNRKKIPGQAPPLSPPSASMPVTTGAQSLSRGTITSYFGSKEGFRKKAHEGVDIGLNQGTPLSFKMKGTVIDSFRTSSTDREAGGGYGSYMDVKFENGQILRLAHLSKIYPHKKFEPGNVVGLSGGTPGYPGSGRSGGPHLHLEQHSSKIGLEETLKGKLDPIKYGGFGLVQTGGVIKKFSRGGRVSKPTYALIGEEGPEFVFDADTTAGLDRLAPQLLEQLNFASTKPQLASILQSYAPYDAMSPQTIIVPSVSAPEEDGYDSGMSGGVAFMQIGGGDSYDPFYTLEMGS
jgi:murein DD-endopeptidase MepM/ murein hydrolase activator NlpD